MRHVNNNSSHESVGSRCVPCNSHQVSQIVNMQCVDNNSRYGEPFTHYYHTMIQEVYLIGWAT